MSQKKAMSARDIELPPLEEMLLEFDGGSIPRSETWQILITGLYLNNEQVAQIEQWYEEINTIYGQILEIQGDITTRYGQIEIWHGEVDTWQQQVSDHKDAAQASETAAKASEEAAATSESNASDSEEAAASSATAAASSESNASDSEAAAKFSEDAAASSESSASGSATAASSSASAAASSETNAAASESAAAASETNAASSEANASDSESAALASEEKAQKWAEEEQNVPVEENEFSAFHWAKVAEQFAGSLTNGMYFAGRWDMADGLPEEPEEGLVPWYRIITTEVESTTHLAAQDPVWLALVDDSNPGDQLCWDPIALEWFLIDCTDEVWTVNGKKSDVTLTASDVGAAPEADVETLQQEMLVVQEEVNTAQGDIDDHKAAENPHGIVVPPPGRVNLLLNGDFRIWQRGESFDIGTSSTAYTADRWVVATNTAVVAVNRVGNGLSISSQSAFLISQYIEQPDHLEGKDVTISFDLTWSDTTDLAKISLRWVDEEGVTVGDIVDGDIPEEDGHHSFTLAVPDKEDGAVHLRFLIADSTELLTSMEITNVQLSEGPTEYPFERTHIAEELALCQRYYETSDGNPVFAPPAYSSAGITTKIAHIFFKVSKRTYYPAITATADVGSAGLRYRGISGAGITILYGSGIAPSSVTEWTADAEI